MIPVQIFTNDTCRLSQLEQAVNRLTDTVTRQAAPLARPTGGEQDGSNHDLPRRELQDIGGSDDAPLLVIRDAARDTQTPAPPPPLRPAQPNIIDKRLVTKEEAAYLLHLFRSYYERWIAFGEPEDGDSQVNTYSPLLLCACCLIAVRHSTSHKARETAAVLFDEAKALLSEALLQTPQQLDFFRAVLVLSLWSTTVGQQPLSIDSWLITGFAIQHGSAGAIFRGPRLPVGKALLWTRLCLAHLHSCITMRRNSIIRRADVEPIRRLIATESLSNYDTRMIAELNLYWIIYEHYVPASAFPAGIDLPKAQDALAAWRREWAFLFDEPRSQFISMGILFAHLLMYEQSLHSKSAAVRESLIAEMVRLCTEIVTLAMETADERTKHLTDHIYHMITFSAVTLTRLLAKYESQLITSTTRPGGVKIAHCDRLIMETVQWLNSLGSPMHVGHTMAQIIDTVHRKLRPAVRPQAATATNLLTDAAGNAFPPPLPLGMPPDVFPDLLGMDALDYDWEAILPELGQVMQPGMPGILPR